MVVPEIAGWQAVACEKMDKKQQLADKKLLAIVQDIKYARYLSDNDKKTRERALKGLKKWFAHCSHAIPFTESDLLLIWKGLFYSMWMSDKPLVQEECAESIAQLIHSLTPQQSLLYFRCGMKLLGNEWFGIDQWRLDKFMMLVRRLLRQAITVVKKETWNAQFVKRFQKILEETVMSTANKQPIGLCLHFTEVYLEELAKVSEGELNENVVTQLVTPFIKYLALSDEPRIQSCILKSIFTHLMNQSDIGIDHSEKFKMWRSMKFAGGNIDALQKQEVSDEEEEDDGDEIGETKHLLDPRAGKVDVVLPQLKFSAKQIINIAQNYKFHASSSTHSRKIINKLIEDFSELSKGKYPLGLKKIELGVKDGSMKLKKSAQRLAKYQKKLRSDKRGNVFEDVNDETGGSKRKADLIGEQLDAIMVKRKKRKQQTENEDMQWEAKVESVVMNGDRKTTKKSTKELKPLNKRKKRNTINESAAEVLLNNLEAKFDRNSGTWFVYTNETDQSDDNLTVENGESIESNISLKFEKQSPQKTNISINNKLNVSSKDCSSESFKTQTKRKSVSPSKVFQPEQNSTPAKVFKQSEWDAPLQEGETEIFVPARKYQEKMASIAKKSNKNVADLINASISKIKAKNRHSLDPKLVRNPFCTPTPKKVKINVRLNKSQEVHEHVARIKRSPAIPFDPNRKPEKTLLKPNISPSPINPFYRRKMNL